MQDQPKYIPLRASEFFSDGRSSRLPVNGTVARGQLKADTYFYTGKIGNVEGDKLPFPATEQVLARGRERYNIYCTPCHSRLGDGNGMVVQRGFRQAGDLDHPKLVNAPIGHFFNVISNGFGAMPDYAAQISPQDRWMIAAYIRVLQFSQNATLKDVPAEMRGKIKTLAEVQAEQEGNPESEEGTSSHSTVGGHQPDTNKQGQRKSPQEQGTPKH